MNLPVTRSPDSPTQAGAEDGPQDRGAYLARAWILTRRSANTRYAYGRDLGVPVPRPGVAHPPVGPRTGTARAPSWLDYCHCAGIDPLGPLREEHIALWARGMETAGLSPSSVARKVSTVSSWYTWLEHQGHVLNNPVRRLPRPAVDRDVSTTPGLTRDQAQALLAAADRGCVPGALEDASGRKRPWPQARRNAALLAVMLYTGARVSEVCGATIADLGIDRGHRVLWVTRKGGTRQPLALPPPAVERLDAYLATRPATSLPVRPGEEGAAVPLFASAAGLPLAQANVWDLIRYLARAAGLPGELVGHLGPHSMRHSFATLYLDAGGSLRDLQDAMGHKDPRTTRRYDRSRNSLDRSPGYVLATYLATEGGDSE